MCIYRNVIRLLAMASVAGSAIFGIAATSSAQLAAEGRVGRSASPIELVAAGSTILWTHGDGESRALYTASAPDYIAARVAGREAATLRGLAELGATSPDGAWVLYLRNGLLYRLAADEGSPAEIGGSGLLFETRGVITHAVWSPDGSRIAFVMLAPKARSAGVAGISAVPSFIGVFDLESGRRWYLSPAIEQDSSPVWSADGSEIFFQRSTGPSLAAGVRSHAGAGMTGAGMTGAQGGAIMIGDVESGEARVIWTPEDEVALIGPWGSRDDGPSIGGMEASR